MSKHCGIHFLHVLEAQAIDDVTCFKETNLFEPSQLNTELNTSKAVEIVRNYAHHGHVNQSSDQSVLNTG